MNPPPLCPKCNSNSQVWVNKLSGKLTCHRWDCYIALLPDPTPEPFEPPFLTLPYKVTIATESTGDVQIPFYKRKKPSLLARLFSGIGTKYKRWSRRNED